MTSRFSPMYLSKGKVLSLDCKVYKVLGGNAQSPEVIGKTFAYFVSFQNHKMAWQFHKSLTHMPVLRLSRSSSECPPNRNRVHERLVCECSQQFYL